MVIFIIIHVSEDWSSYIIFTRVKILLMVLWRVKLIFNGQAYFWRKLYRSIIKLSWYRCISRYLTSYTLSWHISLCLWPKVLLIMITWYLTTNINWYDSILINYLLWLPQWSRSIHLVLIKCVILIVWLRFLSFYETELST